MKQIYKTRIERQIAHFGIDKKILIFSHQGQTCEMMAHLRMHSSSVAYCTDPRPSNPNRPPSALTVYMMRLCSRLPLPPTRDRVTADLVVSEKRSRKVPAGRPCSLSFASAPVRKPRKTGTRAADPCDTGINLSHVKGNRRTNSAHDLNHSKKVENVSSVSTKTPFAFRDTRARISPLHRPRWDACARTGRLH